MPLLTLRMTDPVIYINFQNFFYKNATVYANADLTDPAILLTSRRNYKTNATVYTKADRPCNFYLPLEIIMEKCYCLRYG